MNLKLFELVSIFLRFSPYLLYKGFFFFKPIYRALLKYHIHNIHTHIYINLQTDTEIL